MFEVGKLFPSPLEVDRYLYLRVKKNQTERSKEFPSPLEVDRYLYI